MDKNIPEQTNEKCKKMFFLLEKKFEIIVCNGIPSSTLPAKCLPVPILAFWSHVFVEYLSERYG